MNAIANTTVSLYRGTTISEFDDEVDDPTADPYLTGEPASLIEIPTPDVTETTDQTPRVIWRARMRIKSTIDIRRGDWVKDESTGTFWTISTPTPPIGNPAISNDRRVDLRRQ